MNEKELCVKMFVELRPKLLKRIVLTLTFVELAYRSFEELSLRVPVSTKDLASDILGLVMSILVWIDFYLSQKLYRKYQNELIDLTKTG
jgi:hypothetical protein